MRIVERFTETALQINLSTRMKTHLNPPLSDVTNQVCPNLSFCLRKLSHRRAPHGNLSPDVVTAVVLLPESFRGSCSFGVDSIDLSHDRTVNTKFADVLFSVNDCGLSILHDFICDAPVREIYTPDKDRL
jgi:hypothetical protein